MSLETVLQIGKVLRNSENSLKYFKYVEPCPKDKDGNWPICITIPVKEDFSFDWEGMKITSENKREELYYLKYSTSDNDSSPKKYLFGDICYTRKSEVDKTGKIKGIKDFGNFTFEKGQGNAFINGLKAYEGIVDSFYSSTILPFFGNEKRNQEALLKAIINGYKIEKKIDLPKKLKEYSSIIESSIQTIKECEKNCELIKFHVAFEKEIEKFNQLLLYAPAFEYIIFNEKEKLKDILTNQEELRDKYLDVIKRNNLSTLKRLLEKDESFDFLSAETRNKMIQFADFTVFIHFEFIKDNKCSSWFQFDNTFKLIKDKLNSEVTNTSEHGFVPSKSIYRTLCSGNDKNDIQFPTFDLEKSFRSFSFRNHDQFEDFLYSGSILNKSFRRLRYTDIDMFVFPVAFNGEQI
ncbi:MAG: hypothetical protein PHQ11_14340, partial [Paludibacter sp.]|nr:hypothetical protein [Paludibacter sp.]